MVMRTARAGDAAALARLWEAAGLHFRPENVAGELRSALARDTDLVIVEEAVTGELIGSVFGTFDGRRGWVSKLAAHPGRRGLGIGTALVRELERRLRARGCRKANLLIERGNAAVTAFYERLGYRRNDVLFMERWLDGTPTVPTVPAAPAARPAAPAARPDWSGLKPDLHDEPYVFVSVPALPALPAGADPFAIIREAEGLTVVLTRDQADRAGLSYGYVAERVTLTINSELAAVGLTAAVSRVLAAAGISCNVIAGAVHDHLFVAAGRGREAAGLLARL